jgi:hypothetical protein
MACYVIRGCLVQAYIICVPQFEVGSGTCEQGCTRQAPKPKLKGIDHTSRDSVTMANHFLQLRGFYSWKYVLVVIPLILFTLFIFLDTEATITARLEVVTIWSNISPAEEDLPLRKPTSAPLNETEEYVALCMAAKNQAKDLREFFVHHYNHMGIRRFYIVDDGSDPPLETFTDYGILREAITFKYWDPEETKDRKMQPIFYNDCIEQWGSKHTWMGFVDTDEFFDTPGPESLPEILKSFEANTSVGALGVNWRTHTSGGLEKRPPSNRQSFTTCIIDEAAPNGVVSDNLHVKSIVKTSFYIDPESPHTFHLKNNAITVGEHGDEVWDQPRRVPVTRDRIGLHHYGVKSREEYKEKMLRSNANKNAKGWWWWDHIEDEMPHVPCLEMTLYDP